MVGMEAKMEEIIAIPVEEEAHNVVSSMACLT